MVTFSKPIQKFSRYPSARAFRGRDAVAIANAFCEHESMYAVLASTASGRSVTVALMGDTGNGELTDYGKHLVFYYDALAPFLNQYLNLKGWDQVSLGRAINSFEERGFSSEDINAYLAADFILFPELGLVTCQRRQRAILQKYEKPECGLPPRPPIFKIGDAVTFINDAGIEWPGKEIIGMTHWGRGEWRYYYAPTETPWFPSEEKSFILL